VISKLPLPAQAINPLQGRFGIAMDLYDMQKAILK
jgi:hypothetical protein